MECKGYIYVTTYIPTGEKYFGSRKLKEGVTPETDGYRGSPADTNLMFKLFETRPAEEFSKDILFVGEYEEVVKLENLAIEAAWERWGKVSEGGLVTNLAAWGRKIVVTDEIRAKISATLKGKPKSAEHRSKMSAAASNPSVETRAKMSAAKKGKTHSAEARAKMSAAKSRAVINTATGQTWPSVNAAAKLEGISHQAMSKRIHQGAYGGIWQYA